MFQKGIRLLCFIFKIVVIISLFKTPAYARDKKSHPNHTSLEKPIIVNSYISRSSNVWTYLLNYGQIGGYGWTPSFEWPGGSDLSYLFDGAIWVGAIDPENNVRCTHTIFSRIEWNPTEQIDDTVRIYNTNDPFFQNRPNVHPSFTGRQVSLEDTYAAYTDIDIKRHRYPEAPLGLKIIERTYKWNDAYNDDFIIFDFQIINIGLDTDQDLFPDSPQKLRDVYIGIWMDGDISFATYLDDLTAYLPDIKCSYLYDDDGDGGLSEGFLYTRLLKASGGTPQRSYTDPCSHSWWNWSNDPSSDYLKYEYLSNPKFAEVPPAPYDYRFLQGVGPFDMESGDTINAVYAMGVGQGMEGMIRDSDWAKKIFDAGYRAATSPDPPVLTVEKSAGSVKLMWDTSAEESLDPLTGQQDFEGYRLYKSRRFDEFGRRIWIKLADFDKVNSVGANTGLQYEYVDNDVLEGYSYSYAVSSYDRGDPQQGLSMLESSLRDEKSSAHIIIDTQADKTKNDIYVYPNPYVGSVEWDHVLTTEEPYRRKLVFANLPPGYVKITVFTLAGDIVDTIIKDNEDALAIWDMLTNFDRELASGIYLYTVESETVKHTGKFVVIQ